MYGTEVGVQSPLRGNMRTIAWPCSINGTGTFPCPLLYTYITGQRKLGRCSWFVSNSLTSTYLLVDVATSLVKHTCSKVHARGFLILLRLLQELSFPTQVNFHPSRDSYLTTLEFRESLMRETAYSYKVIYHTCKRHTSTATGLVRLNFTHKWHISTHKRKGQYSLLTCKKCSFRCPVMYIHVHVYWDTCTYTCTCKCTCTCIYKV